MKRVSQEDAIGYRQIGDSIDFIMKGLQRKENTDMKSLISEIYKIKKVVDMSLQGWLLIIYYCLIRQIEIKLNGICPKMFKTSFCFSQTW